MADTEKKPFVDPMTKVTKIVDGRILKDKIDPGVDYYFVKDPVTGELVEKVIQPNPDGSDPVYLITKKFVGPQAPNWERLDRTFGTEYKDCAYMKAGVIIPESLFLHVWTEADVRNLHGDEEKFLNPFLTDEKGVQQQHNTAEIKTVVLDLIPPDLLVKAMKFKVLDEATGEELYKSKKSMVVNIEQHGDLLFFPDKLQEVPLDNETLIALRANVYYKLLSSSWSLNGVEITMSFLEMGNASEYETLKKRHLERVPGSCETILDAIYFRNKFGYDQANQKRMEKGFGRFSWELPKNALPYQLA